MDVLVVGVVLGEVVTMLAVLIVLGIANDRRPVERQEQRPNVTITVVNVDARRVYLGDGRELGAGKTRQLFDTSAEIPQMPAEPVYLPRFRQGPAQLPAGKVIDVQGVWEPATDDTGRAQTWQRH